MNRNDEESKNEFELVCTDSIKKSWLGTPAVIHGGSQCCQLVETSAK